MDDGLAEFILTMDPDLIEAHPLDEGGPEGKPVPLFTNLIVLRAFWETNGFRDGNGGAIMPATIEWWIDKEKADLTPEQIRDIRDLVPVADQHWRYLQMKKLDTERTSKEV